jgi:hypothetical protein
MNTVPIQDVLPWGYERPPVGGRTTLICDSAETDGKFLLYTIAAQCLSSSSKAPSSLNSAVPASRSSPITKIASASSQYNIIWINCGLKTEAQISAAMKKIGCDIRTNEKMVHIITLQVPTDLGGAEYLKQLYQGIHLKTATMSNYVIILDDATLLSTYFGPSLTYTFIQMLQRLIRRSSSDNDAGLVLRASHDLDQEYYLSTNQEQKSVTGNKVLNYIGAGGRGMLHDSESLSKLELGSQYELEELVWERSLVELADGVIDVVPLSSGFAKDVHGRLVFTSRWGAGLGWRKNDESILSSSTAKNNFSTTLVNFCCSDAGVRAIRLRV